jgi:hypothetical protein
MKNFRLPAVMITTFALAMIGCQKKTDGNQETDSPALSVSSVSPTNNQTGVALNATISATFNKTVNTSSVQSDTFTLSRAGASVAGTLSFNGTTATFTPSTNLFGNTLYTATAKTGIKDSSGKGLSSDYSWTFTTQSLVMALAAKVDFTTGSSPWGAAIGDLDGDGKADIVISNSAGTSISVFRNTSTSGVIDATSFAAKVDFTTGTTPYNVAIADIDGDGKKDIAVTSNGSARLSIFRNTSTSGTINTGSFAAKLDFVTGNNPTGLGIADFDGDGKIDLAVSNNTSTSMSVFRNTSTSGSISLSAKVDFTTGSGPNALVAADFDGDGKKDIAVISVTSSTINVFRNTSTSGTIDTGSFAAKVDFTVNSSSYTMLADDLDGDGKIDMASASYGNNNISVFRNTSTSGTITTGSFVAKVDFTSGTNPVTIAAGDLDNDGKNELITSNSGSANASVFRNTSTSGSLTSGSFAAKVDYTTGTSPYHIAVGDLDGDGKNEFIAPNLVSTTVSVFRNTSAP